MFNRKVLVGIGSAFIVLAVVILGTMAWEVFGGATNKFMVIELPGFHELTLKNPGLYAGVYQQRGQGAIPVDALSHMEIHVMSKKTFQEIPLLMNNTGQTFSQFGLRGMPLFNFMAPDAGDYTLSGVYADGKEGPRVDILLFSEAAQNIRQTLIVGSVFFFSFLGLGIWILIKSK